MKRPTSDRTNRSHRFGIVTLALALGLALGPISGCQSQEEQVQALLAEAAEFRDEEEYTESLRALKEALRIDPRSAETNLAIAETLTEIGRVAEAAFYYGEAYRLDDTQHDAALAQAGGLFWESPEEAEALIESVLSAAPDYAPAYTRRAELELVRSDTDAALAAAFTATELAPDDPKGFRVLGLVYRAIVVEKHLRGEPLESEDYEAAIGAFQKAQERSDDHWIDRKEIAETYSDWPEHGEQALAAWQAALDRASEEEDEQPAIAVARKAFEAAERSSNRELEIWALEKRIELEPGDLVAVNRLSSVLGNDDPAAGDAVWLRALEGDPENARLHAGYVRHLGRSSRAAPALAHLEGLDDEVANEAPVLASWIEILVEAPDQPLDRAREILETMQRDHPGHLGTRLSQARIELAAGETEEAAASLRQLADETEHPDVLWLLSVAEWRLENPRAALAALDRAIDRSPVPRAAHYRFRLHLLSRTRDWDEAQRTLMTMRRHGIGLRRGEQTHLVNILYETGQAPQAREVLDQMLTWEDRPSVAVLTFVRYESRRQPERARKLLQEEVERDPENRLVFLKLVELEIEQRNYDRALELLNEREAVEPLVPELRLLRARALIATNRLEEAEVDARAAFLAKQSPPRSGEILLSILSASGRRTEAVELLEGQRDSEKLDARGYWLLGRLYIDEGNLAGARGAFERSLELKPGRPVVVNDLAYVLAEQGEDLDRAIDLARQAKAEMPRNPAIADTLGWVYYRRGLYRPAAAEFRTAVRLAGKRVSAAERALYLYHLGLTLGELGESEEAVRVLDEALDLEPEHAEAKAARAKLAG